MLRALLITTRIGPWCWLAVFLALPWLAGCQYLERYESGFRDEEPAWGRAAPEDLGESMGLSRKSRDVERHLGIE